MQANIAVSTTSYDYMNQLLAIIDSKIQYIGFELKQLFGETEASAAGQSRSDSADFLNQAKAAFPIIEYKTRQKRLLLLLRKYLDFQNLSLVYQLIEQDRYADLSVVLLKETLLGKTMLPQSDSC